MEPNPASGTSRGDPSFLVSLSAEHPGFKDPVYRVRRDKLAQQARDYATGTELPRVAYTKAEQVLWTTIWQRLEALHEQHVCRALLPQAYGLDWHGGIPQLADLSVHLTEANDFRMEPVPGLVTPAVFFEALSRGVFLSTTYIRHPSRPFYTPEPDIVHEIVGHAASLMHPRIAAVSHAFGRAASTADEAELERLIRLYWYTVEFGLVREDGELKAWGAGLLSSVAELEAALVHERLLEWDPERIAATDFDPTELQPQLFVAPSLDWVLEQLLARL
jgi:phenylalanine-4-hydroxylase